MPLTDTAIRNAKPFPKPRRLYDERGLYLEVSPAGGKWWRFKYRFDGKEKRISLGTYPDIKLGAARERRDQNRTLIANGIDPSIHRQTHKQERQNRIANNFEAVAREWFSKRQSTWTESYAFKIKSRLENDIFPWLGARSLSDISAPELLKVIRRIEERGAVDTAHRVLGFCGQIFRYGVATGRAERDPSADLKGALPAVKGAHFAAIVEPKRVGALLRMIDDYHGSFVVRCALRLAPLVFVRPGELRRAKWEDIDFENAEWRFQATKTDTAHIVPLSQQALAVLLEIKPLTGQSPYVFPSARTGSRPMSENAILAALRRMGIDKDEMSGHGFRAMARTILDEVLKVRPDYIEHQLAHAVRDPNGRAYNRTAFLPERKAMMQQWADYLDEMKVGTVASEV